MNIPIAIYRINNDKVYVEINISIPSGIFRYFLR